MLFPVATTNYGGLHSLIPSLWLLICCFLWPQQTMATPIHKYPLCDFSNVLSCGHNELWLPCMRRSPHGPLQVYVEYDGVTRRGCHTRSTGIFTSIKAFTRIYESLQTIVADKCHKDSFLPTRWTLQLPQMCTFKERLQCQEVLHYHNKLWLPPSTKTLSVTSQNFFPVATTNYGCPHLQITSLWLLRCCFVCPQQTMTSQMLFPVATTNYSCPHLQIPSLWILDHFRVTISH